MFLVFHNRQASCLEIQHKNETHSEHLNNFTLVKVTVIVAMNQGVLQDFGEFSHEINKNLYMAYKAYMASFVFYFKADKTKSLFVSRLKIRHLQFDLAPNPNKWDSGDQVGPAAGNSISQNAKPPPSIRPSLKNNKRVESSKSSRLLDDKQIKHGAWRQQKYIAKVRGGNKVTRIKNTTALPCGSKITLVTYLIFT